MAPFLSRLISIQKRFSTIVRSDEQYNDSERAKSPEFDSSKQVRVLLFRELNGQDRRLLFDSKSVRKRDPSVSDGGGGVKEKSPLHLGNKRYQESSIEKSFKLNDNQSKEFVYEWQKSSPDEQMLREMIFGSVSISYQGTTFKVHLIRSPLQIMLSVVFAAPPIPMFRIGEQEAEESGSWNTAGSEISIVKTIQNSDIHLAHSVPVDVPSRFSGHHFEYRDSDSDSLQPQDGYSSLPTTHLSPESSSTCLPRSSSYNSLQRRLLRNKATSIEMGLQKPDDISNDDYSRAAGQKRVKLGLSIVINLNENDKSEEKQFTHFLFTHMSLIEGYLMNLKDTVVRAYLNRRSFVQLMFEGAQKFQRAIQDLYTASRLQNPEWLTIISSSNHRHLSYAFLGKFSNLLKQYDKKETHFFVSTLLTAVLTHHLSWVPSVIPTDSKIHSTQTSHKHTPCWVDLLSKSRPYNPHWVQLSDLYGALGPTLKLSKTVVKGQKKDVVLKFLQVLSYFIRCSDICEQVLGKMALGVISSDVRLQSINKSSTIGDKSSLEVTAIQSSLMTTESCNLSCCTSKQNLKNLNCFLKSVDAVDTDSASDSSKDMCDVSITPTEERISENSIKSIDAASTDSKPVFIVLCDCVETDKAKESESNSLGYVSLKDSLDVSKRLILQQQVFCQGLSNAAPGSHLNQRNKKGIPTLYTNSNRTWCKKCCSCNGCPCYDKPPLLTKDCDSMEEGYHSMEEPHSPSRFRTHLSEMLKQYKNGCPEGLEEVPLTELLQSGEAVSPPYSSFGWSLMGGITNHYLMDFCLQGLCGPLREEEIREDLLRLTNSNVLGEEVSEAVCIIADTDKWNVQLLSSNFVGGDSLGMPAVMSSSVSGMCDAILNMCELGISPESCIIYLEDRLQELYFQSQMLSDYLHSNRSNIPLSKISNTLNVDVSDMPLLLSVATTHSTTVQNR